MALVTAYHLRRIGHNQVGVHEPTASLQETDGLGDNLPLLFAIKVMKSIR
jgi:hypothetical protein